MQVHPPYGNAAKFETL
nr:ribulose biphosphate carboxylase small subunit, RuBisCo small subunit, SSP\